MEFLVFKITIFKMKNSVTSASWWHKTLFLFVPPQQQQKDGIYPWAKVPLRELWDLAPYAKGPVRNLSHLCAG